MKNSMFAIDNGPNKELQGAAEAALSDAVDLQAGETILFIANPDDDIPEIATTLFNAALHLGSRPTLVYQTARQSIEYTEETIINAMESEPDVVFTLTRESLGSDRRGLTKPYAFEEKEYDHIFNYLMFSGKCRAVWCPGITTDMFIRTVPIDYPLMWRRASSLKKIIDAAKSIHITTPGGTDLVVGMEGRPGLLDDGDYRMKGKGGNLPAGEVFTVPDSTSHGTAVIDGSFSHLNGSSMSDAPIILTIRDGQVTRIQGKESARIFEESLNIAFSEIKRHRNENLLSSEQAAIYLRNYRNLSELGIGLNPHARITGNMTEDEKVLNTCHIAIGDDCNGYAPSLIHLDLLMKEPRYSVLLTDGTSMELDPLNPPEVN